MTVLMNQNSLFRQEVIDNRLHRHLGTTRINVPLNYQITSILTLILLVVITIFLCFAETSERTYIRGHLDSDVGIITVNSEAGGIINQAGIEEGKHVKRGDMTIFLSTGCYSA